MLADYLAESFPVKPRPAAVLIPGSATVSIREWVVPSLGSRPHDPLAAADGSIWWTGQWARPGAARSQDGSHARVYAEDA